MARPLSGISLVEAVSHASPPGLRAAIGLAGRVAADLGARVTRVVTASDMEEVPFLQAGKQILRAHGNGAAALLAHCVIGADVLVSDLATASMPGVTPRRVGAVLSMDGSAEGDADHSEFSIEALSGLLNIVGDPARMPLRLGGHQTAYAAGLAAFTALMAALCQPALADGPRHVRVSLLETAIWLNWKGLAVAQRTGVAPKRAGSNAEWPVLPCADGYVVVVHRMQEWQRMMSLLDDPAMREERFQTPAGRREHRSDLNAILARYFATLTRAEIHDISLQNKLPFGAVWSPGELLTDPQMVARDMFHMVPLEGGSVPQPRLPALWSGAVS